MRYKDMVLGKAQTGTEKSKVLSGYVPFDPYAFRTVAQPQDNVVVAGNPVMEADKDVKRMIAYDEYLKKVGSISQAKRDVVEKDFKDASREAELRGKGIVVDPGTPEWYMQGIGAATVALAPVESAATLLAKGVENGVIKRATGYDDWQDMVSNEIGDGKVGKVVSMMDPAFMFNPRGSTVSGRPYGVPGVGKAVSGRPLVNMYIPQGGGAAKITGRQMQSLPGSNNRMLALPKSPIPLGLSIVDNKGNVNIEAFDFFLKSNGLYDSLNGIMTRRKGEPQSVYRHLLGAAQIARDTPYSGDRRDAVTAALFHDIGKAKDMSHGHGVMSANILRNNKLFRVSDDVLKSIAGHMSDRSWSGTDLDKFLVYSDVASGRTVEDAMTRYPHLLTFDYPKQKPLNPNLPWREDIKNLNYVLKASGYKTIPLDEELDFQVNSLNDAIRRHRTVVRGLRLPKDDGSQIYKKFEEFKSANDLTPEEALRESAGIIPFVPSGNGRSRVFYVGADEKGKLIHGQAQGAHTYKLNPKKVDVIYSSNSNSTATTYGHTSDGRYGDRFLLRMPYEEFKEGSPSTYFLNNDWTLFNIERDNDNMSIGQMFATPYRLQTGRSFYNDYGSLFTGKKFEYDPTGFPTYRHNSEIDDYMKKLGYDPEMFAFKPENEYKTRNNVKRLYNISNFYNLTTKDINKYVAPYYPKLAKFLKSGAPKELKKKYYDKTYRNLVGRVIGDTYKDYLTRNKYKLTDEYKKFMTDRENIYKFMKEKGVPTKFELENWNDYYSLAFPQSKGRTSFYLFPGLKGEKKFDTEILDIEKGERLKHRDYHKDDFIDQATRKKYQAGAEVGTTNNKGYRGRWEGYRESENVIDLRDLPDPGEHAVLNGLIEVPSLMIAGFLGEEYIPDFMKSQRMRNIDEAYRREKELNERLGNGKKAFRVNYFQEGGPTDNTPTYYSPYPAIVKGKPGFGSPGWWKNTADKLDNFALAAGFVPVVGDAASFLADVGANIARYKYDINDPNLPEEQRKEIAKSNLKSGLSLAGVGALMGLGTIGSFPSKAIQSPFKGLVRKNKSELNWNADNWFSKRYGDYGKPYSIDNPNGYTQYDVESLASHVPEYEAIEQTAKQNGTWLKMPDGSTWEGDPREWVMMKADTSHYNPVNDEFLGSKSYRSGVKEQNAELFPTKNDFDVWEGTNADIAKEFGGQDWATRDIQKEYDLNALEALRKEYVKKITPIEKKVQKFQAKYGEDYSNGVLNRKTLKFSKLFDKQEQLKHEYFLKQREIENRLYNHYHSPKQELTFSVYPEKANIKMNLSTEMRNWDNVSPTLNTRYITDDFVADSKLLGNKSSFIEGVREGGMNHDMTKSGWNNDLIIHAGTPRVSYLGNNGNLNATRNSNPFIYGSIVPPALLLGTGAAAYNRFNKDKKEYVNGGFIPHRLMNQ